MKDLFIFPYGVMSSKQRYKWAHTGRGSDQVGAFAKEWDNSVLDELRACRDSRGQLFDDVLKAWEVAGARVHLFKSAHGDLQAHQREAALCTLTLPAEVLEVIMAEAWSKLAVQVSKENRYMRFHRRSCRVQRVLGVEVGIGRSSCMHTHTSLK